MPPASKKGTGKVIVPRDRRSSSRHSTPASLLSEEFPSTPPDVTPSATSIPAPTLPKETPYLHTLTASLITPDLSLGALIDKAHAGHKPNDPPTARELNTLHDAIRSTVVKTFEKRGETSERNLRQVVAKRKERAGLEREREAELQAAAVERAKKRSEDEARKGKKGGAKRAREEDEAEVKEGERRGSIPKVGAHGVARQDGVGLDEGAPAPPSPRVEPGTAIIDPMDIAQSPVESEASHMDGQATIPLYERAFGKDPTKFDDPTVYDIRDWDEDMSYEDKKAIFGVSRWPASDLRDLIAGDPPDMDLSNAKPANQINFSTFQTYVEPYIRPFTEEDVAFLKERGDRVTPYLIPQRGTRTYKEVWAAEDGLTGTEPPRREENDPNVARGGMDEMNDEVAETDEVSLGPIAARLMSIIRPQPNTSTSSRPPPTEEPPDTNGDTSMLNGTDDLLDPLATLPGASVTEDHHPLTLLPPEASRLAPEHPKPDFDTFESRALQELKYIGFITPSDTPSHALHNDDEIASRLRTLQAELRLVAARNNARKARLLELTEERMAMQEYSNIADDLDSQVNTAYLKRNRSMTSKPSKKGSATSAAAARAAGRGLAATGRGISEGTKALMQKRRDWIDMVGPVVGYGRAGIPEPNETIFDVDGMAKFEKMEREAEAGEGVEE
ncbi:hypothetical protein B0A48_03662 [Cryoendolithus antarcticus]|uniref:Transcriptional regulator Ngg1 n=1 Tax=Cryoendolithus antarcticus TaxID=1507870 RepID=A0A1V8TKP0_9PEZI|nr:hypothetical protein B0A48_03662 [Cryoendolithus antarcticus]